MGLQDVIRSAVRVADVVTKELQVTVAHHAWTSADATGLPTYASPVNRKAIVESRSRLMRDNAGQEIVASHRVIFLGTPAANGAANRREPIDPRDKLVLPDGTTGQIVAVNGFPDSGTSSGARNFTYEVWLSKSRESDG